MSNKRKKYSADFKAKVALAAICSGNHLPNNYIGSVGICIRMGSKDKENLGYQKAGSCGHGQVRDKSSQVVSSGSGHGQLRSGYIDTGYCEGGQQRVCGGVSSVFNHRAGMCKTT
jgi:hypothetical protein